MSGPDPPPQLEATRFPRPSQRWREPRSPGWGTSGSGMVPVRAAAGRRVAGRLGSLQSWEGRGRWSEAQTPGFSVGGSQPSFHVPGAPARPLRARVPHPGSRPTSAAPPRPAPGHDRCPGLAGSPPPRDLAATSLPRSGCTGACSAPHSRPAPPHPGAMHSCLPRSLSPADLTGGGHILLQLLPTQPRGNRLQAPGKTEARGRAGEKGPYREKTEKKPSCLSSPSPQRTQMSGPPLQPRAAPLIPRPG